MQQITGLRDANMRYNPFGTIRRTDVAIGCDVETYQRRCTDVANFTTTDVDYATYQRRCTTDVKYKVGRRRIPDVDIATSI